VAGTKIEASGKNVEMGLSRIPSAMGRFIANFSGNKYSVATANFLSTIRLASDLSL
jgi:hypothetical protein